MARRTNTGLNRRDLMKTGAVVGAGYWLATEVRESKAANEKLNVACIGIGGRGGANVNGVRSQNIVALCDVDDQRAGKQYERFPNAKKFYDHREMFDAMEKQIDAVTVSTPDHAHFHPSMMALERGIHLYWEKPMAHNVWQVRRMTEKANEKKLATQLGNQRHAKSNMRRIVELIQAKAIGDVTEVHSWIGGSRGMPADPKDFPPVPSHLKWDLWLSQAPERKYSPAYCPYNWRFWWDFGTGETGNWGCHILDIPFWALDLKYPTKVAASGPEVEPEKTPKSMTTEFDFPASGSRPACKLHWYHTSSPEILKKHNLSGRGANTVFIGTEGILVCGFDSRKLYPEDKFKGYKPPAESIAPSPGFHN